MQDKHYEDFDLKLRSMLEDAEVPVPHHVWSGVSSRLDAIQGAAKPRNAWKWVTGVAVAAALGAGIFLTGTFDNNSNLTNNKVSGLMAQMDEVQTAEPLKEQAPQTALPSQDEPLERQQVTAEEPKTAKPEATKKQSLVAGALAPEKTESEEVKEQNNVAQESTPIKAEAGETEVNLSEDTKPGEQKQISEVSTEPDPFTLMAYEDSKKATKKGFSSIYAGGSLANNDASRSAIAMGASGNSQNVVQEVSQSSYGIPLTLGLGVKYHFTPRWAIGTGIDYSLLTRTFTGDYGNEQIIRSDMRHTVQYIGIPLNLYYTILDSRNINFYVFGGGEMEWCVSNKLKVLDGNVTLSDPVKKPQYSVGTGLGVEFKLGQGFGLYLNPGVKYYFDCAQPKSIRTEKPFMLNFQAGILFNF